MYLDFKVKIPSDSAGVTRKKIKGVTYVYYVYEHNYNPEKGYTVPKSTSIGKCADDDAEMMYPNTNFLKFFPAEELPETKGEAYRSGCRCRIRRLWRKPWREQGCRHQRR